MGCAIYFMFFQNRKDNNDGRKRRPSKRAAFLRGGESNGEFPISFVH